MAITHYIDTSLPEIARSRVKSLTNRVTEAFPVLVYGDTRNHNFVFHNAGTVESFSGGVGYSLRVTLGAVQMGPTKGSYTLTCGSSVTVNALSDASTIQAALNGLTTIISDGGVVVTGTFPNFLVTWNTVGVKTAFTVDASLCIPQTGISLVTTQTGSASVVNQVAIVLRQAAISSQSTWTIISSPAAGWTGTVTTNSAGALLLLNVLGQAVGNFIEANTVLTAEVLDSNSVPISYYQTPIILRAKNLDPSASVTPPLTTYTLGDMLYGNAAGTLTRLAGNITTTPKVLMQTGTGAVSAAPVWSTASTLIDGVGSTQGSLIYRGASAWSALTPGSAGALFLSGGAAANPTWTTDLAYSTPTLSVPNAFAISSAGSIALTAGGAAKNITFTPTTTGFVSVVGAGIRLDGTAKSLPAWGVTGPAYSTTGRTYTDSSSSGTVSATTVFNSFAIPILNSTSSVTYSGILANLYIAGDPTVTGNATLSGESYGIYNAGKTRLEGNTIIAGSLFVGTTTNSSNGRIQLVSGTTSAGGIGWGTDTALYRTGNGSLELSGSNTGNTGLAIVTASTGTPEVSLRRNGTASGASIVSFGQNSTEGYLFVNTSGFPLSFYTSGTKTLVLSGAAAATLTGGAGNMTITAGTGNSRTLTLQTTTSGGTATNAVVFGATQSSTFNGPIIQKVSALTYASPTSVDVTLANVYTVTTVDATGSVTFNATAGGTAGQAMTIIITNDATSAKTITFGTNFLANGTLTPSGVGKIATIQFISNGTNFCEVSRTVLP